MDYKWLVSSLLVLVGIGIGLWQFVEARRKQLLVDLQGDKNAVAAVAMRVWSGTFPRRPTRRPTRHRRELFEALCLAAVFQKSGRSRSLIYGALANAGRTDRYRQEIQETVDRITVIVGRSWAYTDLGRARRRLIALRAALHLDEDVRVRVDTFELHARTARHEWPPDSRFRHHAFDWAALESVVNQLGSLILVCPPEGSCAVIALDYHRGARQIGGTGPERMLPTPVGAQVIVAKYQDRSEGTEYATARLVEQLAAVVNRHPVYAGATSLAGVPGRQHDFSDRLAAAVATKTKKPFVSLTQASRDPLTDLPRFSVVDSVAVKDTVIIVDDVYRSGRTLQAVAAVLLDAGAKDVLGLTATCTISAAGLPCAHDSCADDQPDAAS